MSSPPKCFGHRLDGVFWPCLGDVCPLATSCGDSSWRSGSKLNFHMLLSSHSPDPEPDGRLPQTRAHTSKYGGLVAQSRSSREGYAIQNVGAHVAVDFVLFTVVSSLLELVTVII